MPKPNTEATDIDRFPGSLEAVTWRKSTQDFGVTMAVPQEMRAYIKPLMDKLNLYFVNFCIPVKDAAQAEIILDSKEDGIPSLPSDTIREDLSEVTVEELADWLVMTVANIHVLVKKGIAIKVARGRYDLKKSNQGYIRELRQSQKGNDSYHEERARKLRIHNESADIKLAKEKKLLVNAEEVAKRIEENNLKIKNRLLYLPVKLAPQLAGRDEVEVNRVLDDHIRECLVELAGLNVSSLGDSEGKQGVRAAAEAKPERVGGRKKGLKRKNDR